eukprot:COSAG01_NODE_1161_length_11459_cov_47.466549_1_plen_49_part_10
MIYDVTMLQWASKSAVQNIWASAIFGPALVLAKYLGRRPWRYYFWFGVC